MKVILSKNYETEDQCKNVKEHSRIPLLQGQVAIAFHAYSSISEVEKS